MAGIDETAKLLPEYEVCKGCKKVMVIRVYKHWNWQPLCNECRKGEEAKKRKERKEKGIVEREQKDSAYAEWNY